MTDRYHDAGRALRQAWEISMSEIRVRCGYADVEEGQVHYRRAGTGMQALVLLHPTPTSSRIYERALPHLGGDVTAIAFDTPGYGASTRLAGPPTVPGFAMRILKAIDTLGIDRFALCGFATGSTVAVALANRARDRVTHLALSGVPYWEPHELEPFKTNLGPPEMGENGEHMTRIWQSLRNMAPTPDLRPQLHMAAVEALRVYDNYLDALVAVGNYDIRPELAMVTCPMMFLSAEGDKLSEFTARAAKALPHIPYVKLHGIRSQLPWTEPALFADHLLRFIGARAEARVSA